MRFREATAHAVIDTTTADRVGKVSGFLVDSAPPRIVGLRLKHVKGKASLLGWEDIKAFGADAVTIEGPGRFRDAAEDLGASEHDLLGRRILSAGGDELGHVDDVEFDPKTGNLDSLITSAGALASSRILGLGSYAVVVAEAHSDQAAEMPGPVGRTPQRPIEEWTRDELYRRAQELGLEGRSSMTKHELVEALRIR